MSCPRVYWPTDAPQDGMVLLDGSHAHHLSRVLRITVGDDVGLFDGRGHEWVGRVAAVTKQHVQLAGLIPVSPVREAAVPVTLALGLLKGDQMDAVIRDTTMLGVAAIAPMRTAHVTVPQRAWREGAALARWHRVAVASAVQCRRAVVPDIRPVADFEACLAEPVALRLLCAEPGLVDPHGQHNEWKSCAPPSSVQVLIGPEGGWSEREVLQAVSAGARVMTLGPRTLRAETAPTVALAMVASTWGW